MPRLGSSDSFRLQVIVEEEQAAADFSATDLVFAGPAVEGYVFGRSDASSSYSPDIDLAVWNAQQHGISRRHAVLLRYEAVIHLMDLGSMNGTFVNRRRLSPYVPYPLDDGDVIGLANLQMKATSAKAAN